jgi:DNA-directed RNA polymerase specialized sigma24 family protein
MNTRNRIVTAIADVQQEVWLTVYRRIGGLSDPRAFRTWLFQTTRHRAIDFPSGPKA